MRCQRQPLFAEANEMVEVCEGKICRDFRRGACSHVNRFAHVWRNTVVSCMTTPCFKIKQNSSNALNVNNNTRHKDCDVVEKWQRNVTKAWGICAICLPPPPQLKPESLSRYHETRRGNRWHVTGNSRGVHVRPGVLNYSCHVLPPKNAFMK